ncbi:MAG: serine O-acetyltransferase [Parvularculaceae bacterium]|nr:serine O-acetyltransferase [Parvularculaceae bacterium]
MATSNLREAPNLATVDSVWSRMRVEAATDAASEPILASFLSATILNHRDFKSALSYRLAQKLSDNEMNAMLWREVAEDAYAAQPGIVTAALADIQAYVDRDPATKTTAQPFLHFKGFQAIQSHRIGHWLWKEGREALALYLQSRMSELFQLDIHPNARLGQGLFFDHATGIVIGETAVVGDNCSILHSVTLGGTGKEKHERHPKLGNGVLVGAGAHILGNIEVGDGAKIASGSVVLQPVQSFCTVAGVPAVPVGKCAQAAGEQMDQGLDQEA